MRALFKSDAMHSVRLKKKKGISNVIVVVLGLIIVAMIVTNVFLWNYEMNQFDWERMQETIEIYDVDTATNSSWFVAQSEYVLNIGNWIDGTYIDTQTVDGDFVSIKESPADGSGEKFDLVGNFALDVSTYPLEYINSIEIQQRFRASDSAEKWFLKALNWTSSSYDDTGFNSTAGYVPTTGWDYYALNLTDQGNNYVHPNGTLSLKVVDEGGDIPKTTVDIDFLAIRLLIDGMEFTFKNKGSLTCHLLSLWTNNSTNHQRYDVDIFVNAGEKVAYVRSDISSSNGPYIIKIVTERGNIALHSEE
jgi:hypothetical protein